MKKIEQLTVKYHDVTVGILSLTPDGRLCAFEYDKAWLLDGFSISPLELPLQQGVFVAKPQPFFGNFGIFEDSLPDGYGRYLLHKALQRVGIKDTDLSSLDRLSMVGTGGMGALTYHPHHHIDRGSDDLDLNTLQEKALEVLSEQQDTDAGILLFKSGNSGGARPKAIIHDSDGHWLVKFRHTYDPTDMGIQEYRYNEVAKQCGINVPNFKLMDNRYFASRRFDIDSNGSRIHTATAGALLNMSLSTPLLDYSNLLALTGYLTHNEADVEQMFRRMVFNYLTDNKDDHCKNFSFIITQDAAKQYSWHLAPAYDLTWCAEGYNGEHATSVNGTGNPTLEDMVSVGVHINMPEQRCQDLYQEVKSACAAGGLLHHEIKE